MGLLARDLLDADHAFMARLVRQPGRAGDVADGKDAVDIGAAIAIGLDVTPVSLDAELLQPDLLGIRYDPDRDDRVAELFRSDGAVLALDLRGHAIGARGQALDAGALHWYEQSLRSEPRSVETHTEIALLQLRHGELDAAEAAARSGLEIDPNEPMLLVCLSAVYAAQGDQWHSRAVLAQLDGVGTLDDEDSAQIVAARHAIEAVLQ